MFIKYYTSNSATDSDTTLLVETGNSQMSKQLKRKVSQAIFDESGDLHQFKNNVINMWCISKFFTIAFDEDDYEALEETEKWIRSQYGSGHLHESEKMDEDFSMGVEGPTGLNQGIPHGGPGKGVIPAPLFGKGKIVTRDDEKKKLKKALDVLDVYGVKVKKTKKVAEDAMPEWFCRNPWTVDDVDHYLYHDLGFESGEVDDLIALNLDLINELLEKGKSPAEVADALDYSTIQDAED